MPTIDTDLLLDVLLGLIVLLFVPFGVRRGVAKEAMVSAGVLLGAVVADRWADRGGDELAGRFSLSVDTARFAVAVASLAVGAVVLGYGGGAALGRLGQGVLARLAGGLLAALNGALILAYVLAFIQRFLRPGRDVGAIDDGVVGRFLLREFDRFLLAAAAALAVAVVLGLIVTGFRRRNEPLVLPGADNPGIPPRQRPVRFPRGGDAGKYEPDADPPPPGPASRPGRFGGGASSLGQTRPILDRPEPWRGDEPETGASWPRPRATLEVGGPTNGHAAEPAGATDWLRRGSGTLHFDRPSTGDPTLGGDGVARPPTEPVAGETGERRCPTCGAPLGRQDVFCAECGTTL